MYKYAVVRMREKEEKERKKEEKERKKERRGRRRGRRWRKRGRGRGEGEEMPNICIRGEMKERGDGRRIEIGRAHV